MSAAEIVKLVVEFGLEATQWILSFTEEKDRQAAIDFLRAKRLERATEFASFAQAWHAARDGVQAEIDDATKRSSLELPNQLGALVRDATEPTSDGT